jgi:hypothetical protein
MKNIGYIISILVVLTVLAVRCYNKKETERLQKEMYEKMKNDDSFTTESKYHRPQNYNTSSYAKQIESNDNVKEEVFSSMKGHFRFYYPSVWIQKKIDTAQHALLKLEKNNVVLMVSMWELWDEEHIKEEIEDYLNENNDKTREEMETLFSNDMVWNTEFIENFKSDFDRKSGSDVSVKKILLPIRNASAKVLTFKWTMKNKGVTIDALTFVTIHRGNALQFQFTPLNGIYDNSFVELCNDVMKGLELF